MHYNNQSPRGWLHVTFLVNPVMPQGIGIQGNFCVERSGDYWRMYDVGWSGSEMFGCLLPLSTELSRAVLWGQLEGRLNIMRLSDRTWGD